MGSGRNARFLQAGAVFAPDLGNLQEMRDRYTVGGAPTIVNSPFGKAMNFNGTTDYIRVPEYGMLNSSAQLTVSFWIKPSAKTNYDRMVERGTNASRDWYLIYNGDADQKITFLVRNAALTERSAITTSAPPVGAWSFIVGVYNGANALIYYNGALQNTSVALTGNISEVSTTFSVGYESGSADYYFNGVMSNPIIFKRALSATEISNLYYNRFF